MRSPGDLPSSAVLLEHEQFLRRLARSLVRDEHEAADIAQEAMLAAVAQRPRVASLRAWLARVTRNLAARHHRSRVRRARHERAASRDDRTGATVDAVARLETQRRVVGAVLSLPEPYREVVVRRHLDGDKPAAIADSLGLPVETVRTRLKRAHARLRAILDEQDGRAAWSAALIPLLSRSDVTTLAVGTRFVAAVAAMLVLAVAAGVAHVARSTFEPPPSAARAADARRADREIAPGSAHPGGARASTSEAGSTSTADRAPSAADPPYLRTGVASANVRAWFRHYGGEPDPEPVDLVADEQGRVRLVGPDHPYPRHHVDIEVSAPGRARRFESIRADRLAEDVGAALLAATPNVLRGRVVDPVGRPVEGANIVCAATARSGAHGRFELGIPARSVEPFTDGARRAALHVQHHAFLPFRTLLTLPPEPEIELVLDRGMAISGSVRFPDGSPAPGVHVAIGRRVSLSTRTHTRTGADGRYTLTGLREEGPHVVHLYRATTQTPTNGVSGFHRPSLEVLAGTADADFEFDRWIVEVHVLDEAGRPFRYATVTVGGTADETLETDESGTATFLRGDRQLSVQAVAPGHMSAAREIDLATPIGRRRVDVRLDRVRDFGRVDLQIRSTLGGSPDRVYVTLWSRQGGAIVPGWQERAVPLDETGRAQFPRLPAGPYKLRLATSTMADRSRYEFPAYREVEVPAGGAAALDLEMSAGGRIRVFVVDAEGTIVAPVALRLEESSTPWLRDGAATVQTPLGSRASHTTLGPLPPGRYTVVRTAGDLVQRAEVVVEPGRTATVEFVDRR